MADDTIWSSKEIIAAIIATGIVSAAAREVFDWFKSKGKAKREALYIAVRAAIALEEFAQGCITLIEKMEASQRMHGDVHASKLPVSPNYPTDCDWRLLPVVLADELLSFHNEINAKQDAANYTRIFESDGWHLQTVAHELGQQAWDMAKKLRKKYGLKQRLDLSKAFPAPAE